jgi:hypothetical protein
MPYGRPAPGAVLPSDALRLVAADPAAFGEDLRAWEGLSRSTDHHDGAEGAAA